MWLVGKLHPMLVHFPIALILGAAAAELIAIHTGRPAWHHRRRQCPSGGRHQMVLDREARAGVLLRDDGYDDQPRRLIPSATTTPLVDVMKSEMGQVIQVLRSRMQVGLRVDF